MRARAWVFTINNYTQDDELRCKTLECQYMVYGRERGEQGTEHLQGYVYFTNAKSRAAVSKLLPRAYIDRRNGSHNQAMEYCKKENDYFERGEPPTDETEARKRGGEATKILWEEILKRGREGDVEWIATNYPKIYIQLKPRLECLYNPTTTPIQGDLTHEWWVGETGTGKSKTLWELYPKHYEKPLNKWWDGYKHEQVVAIEEWSPANSCTASALKRWADRYPFAGEIKGGVVQRLRPQKIIVLSNYRPDQCFTQQEDLNPILRRFKILEFPRDKMQAGFRAAWFHNPPPPVEDHASDSNESEDLLEGIDLENIWR